LFYVTFQGKCSAKDNFEFWKRLFHTLRMYQEAKPTMSARRYKSICKFWLELSAGPALKVSIQLLINIYIIILAEELISILMHPQH
jgi:hypothetical protein